MKLQTKKVVIIDVGILVICFGVFLMFVSICWGMVRYPVGDNVPVEVYTTKFEPDGIYKFLQTKYLSDPNDPNSTVKIQAAPDDWVQAFGNNERTLLFHTISELRVIMSAQSRKILELESRLKDHDDGR